MIRNLKLARITCFCGCMVLLPIQADDAALDLTHPRRIVQSMIYEPGLELQIRRDVAKFRRWITQRKPKPLVIAAKIAGHDCHIAAMLGGQVLGVIELERFHRIRYFALDAVQRIEGLDETEAVTKYVRPALAQLCEMVASQLSMQLSHPCRIKYDVAVLPDPIVQYKKALQEVINASQWIETDHHHAHAALGWLDSPFYHRPPGDGVALVLSYDGAGNDGTLRTFLGYSGKPDLTPVEQRNGMSFGIAYDLAASVTRDFSWGTPYGSKGPCTYWESPSCELSLAGSFMAFAALGQPRAGWREGAMLLLGEGDWQTSLWPSPYGGHCRLKITDQKGFQYLPEGRNHYFLCDGAGEETSRELDRDFAATIQDALEQSITAFIRQSLMRVQPMGLQHFPTSLVIVGGCALNVKVNSALARHFNLPVHIPSAPSDAGIAVGAGWLIVPPASMEYAPSIAFQGAPLQLGSQGLTTAGLAGLAGQWGAQKLSSTQRLAEMLFDGGIVAVARGRAEFGPRALGHRSLISTAHIAKQKDRLNRLKNRKWYRPCAPIVAAEDLEAVFEPGTDLTGGAPHMSFAPPLQPWVSKLLPAIAHIDSTARPQGVRHEQDPWMHTLLSHVRVLLEPLLLEGSSNSSEKVPRAVGVLINTSLNIKGKPIISDAMDALMIFCEPAGDELDFVLLEEWLFSRGVALARGLCSGRYEAPS